MTLRPILVVFSYSLLLQVKAGNEPDHLLPVDTGRHTHYRTLLQQKLDKTPFDCGRVTIMPAFEPERCISIYSQQRDGKATYSLTCLVAQASLWGGSEMGEAPAKAFQVRVQRTDVVISSGLAQSLKKAFTKVLAETHPLRASEQPKAVITEGPIIEYSIARANGTVGMGEISSIPPTGPKLKILENLTLDLVEYCNAVKAGGRRLEKKIQRNADQLLE